MDTRAVKNYGHGDLMAIAAFRYCLGRTTYIVSDCVDWLIDVWDTLDSNARYVIARDLNEAFERDEINRKEGHQYKELGHNCDRREWERLRSFIQERTDDL